MRIPALIGGLLAAIAAAQPPANNPPTIEYESPACVAPAARARLCAQVVDDSGVGEVNAVFRARGSRGFYRTPMAFDGLRYCAWLPAPLATTGVVEHYIEAFDDAYETSRTRSFELEVRAACGVTFAGAPSGPTVVRRASAAFAVSPAGFDPATLSARP